MADVVHDQDFNFEISDFLGGVHDFVVYEKAPQNSVVKAKNLVFDKGGYLKRRPGLTQVGATFPTAGGPGLGSFCAIVSLTSGANEITTKLVATRIVNLVNVQFGILDNQTWTFVGPTLIGIILGVFQSGSAAWVREEDGTKHIYSICGFGGIFNVDYEAATVGSTPSIIGRPAHSCRVIVSHLDRIWVTYLNSDEYDAVVYSPAGIPEGIGEAANDANILKFDGERVLSIVPYRDTTLMIGTDRSLWLLLVGTSENLLDWQKSRVSSEVGVYSHATVSFMNEDLIFTDQNGNVRSLKGTLYSLQGGVAPVPLSYPIKQSLRNVIYNSRLFANSVVYDGLYIVNGHEDDLTGLNGQTWIFDSFFNSWTGPHAFGVEDEDVDFGANVTASHACSGPSSSSLFFAKTRTFDAYFALGTASDCLVAKWDLESHQDSFAASGSGPVAIPTELVTRRQDFGYPQQEKFVKWLEVEYGDDDEGYDGVGSITVEARTEKRDSWLRIGSTAYDTTTKRTVTKYPMHALGRAKLFQVRVKDSSNTDGPKLRKMRFYFQAQEIKDN